MGWCSGTEIFDRIAKIVIENPQMNNRKELLVTLIDALEENDWDCQSESEYIEHPLVRSAFIEIDPDWQEYFDDIDAEKERTEEEIEQAVKLKENTEKEELYRLADKYGAQLSFHEALLTGEMKKY